MIPQQRVYMRYKRPVAAQKQISLEHDPNRRCVICGDRAFYTAPETNEPLCYRCFTNNSEAGMRRRYNG